LIEVENLTPLETAAILSQVLDRPIKYIRVTIESLQQQLVSFGATPDVQRELGQIRNLGQSIGLTIPKPSKLSSSKF
jgi:uncharacterized protein YbjT (DUF2867 family)